ncbi:RdgB/HAM1 family non-canonical purine NTP pyrophosphatase [Candidatus Pelagibacter sp.]|nr:RdgB/HAM1 family non-canonical purine NTP pyrophosphatase [Candidatus Pelagibacter sp.]
MKAKKISQLLIGTNNKGKLREIKALLPKNIKIYSTSDYNLKSPKENGKTFRENSLIKASFFSKKSKQICMSDDSGLEINLLNNQPGIYSARWGGKKNNFDLAIKKVFKKLDKQVSNWRNRKINAKFICALTIYWPSGKYKTTIGKILGKISNKKIGKRGFGYDPIFIPRGSKKTFGQISPKKKYKIDHRYKAFQKIKKFL